MLNWIALWVGDLPVRARRAAPERHAARRCRSRTTSLEEAKLPVFWGDPLLQGLHVGFFVALAALVVYWIMLNRTTLGYEVRAVGFNPEAARYGGISVARNYFLAMAISGAFAGLAGRARHPRLAVPARHERRPDARTIGFVGIAVALLGRNTAVGVGLAALLFGALLTGTSTRNLDPEIFQPELASNLTLLIQGARRALRRRRRAHPLRARTAPASRRRPREAPR